MTDEQYFKYNPEKEFYVREGDEREKVLFQCDYVKIVVSKVDSQILKNPLRSGKSPKQIHESIKKACEKEPQLVKIDEMLKNLTRRTSV